jgi:hypothetical protein
MLNFSERESQITAELQFHSTEFQHSNTGDLKMAIVPKHLSDPFQTHQEQEWTSAKRSDGFRLRFEDTSQWLNQTARAIAHALIGSSDPFIWQKSDRNGNTWWIIDDPLTGTRFHALSEEEVRAWIDQRYYAQPKSIETTSRQINPRLIERW